MAASALKNVLVSFLLPASDGGGTKAIATDDCLSPVRAAAYKVLARDPDPATTKGLTDAACEKGWTVQTAAPQALARRGERSALSTEKYMSDEKDKVRYSATAAVPPSWGMFFASQRTNEKNCRKKPAVQEVH
jgi:hypothetical protein